MQQQQTLTPEAESLARATAADLSPSSLVHLNVLCVDGIYYGFAISRLVWYKARLYIGLCLPHDTALHSVPGLSHLLDPPVHYLQSSSHATKLGAMKKLDEFEARARRGEFIGSLPRRLKVVHQMLQIEKFWNFHLDLHDFVRSGCDTAHLMIIGTEDCSLVGSTVEHSLIQMVTPSGGKVEDAVTMRGYAVGFEYCSVQFTLELHFLMYYNRYYGPVRMCVCRKRLDLMKCALWGRDDRLPEKIFVLRGLGTGRRSVPIFCTNSFGEVQRRLGALFDRNIEVALGADAILSGFTEVVEHRRADWRQQNGQELSSTFRSGSVLLVAREAYYRVFYHAAVYLDFDLVIHVRVQDGFLGHIFCFGRFEDYVGPKDQLIYEYRFALQPFSRDELYSRALAMNDRLYAYSLRYNNCEHLAFELAIGLKTSTQMNSLIKRAFAALVSVKS